MRVFLVGFMSAGKTTLGYQLARSLNMRFTDLDQLITRQLQKPIDALFAEHGEDGFREIEKNALHSTFKTPELVLATGGGTPCFFDNMDYMIKNGLAFYLKLPREIIIKRLLKSVKERPLVSGKSYEELETIVHDLYETRKKFYEKAQYSVDASNKNALHYIVRILSGYMY